MCKAEKNENQRSYESGKHWGIKMGRMFGLVNFADAMHQDDRLCGKMAQNIGEQIVKEACRISEYLEFSTRVPDKETVERIIKEILKDESGNTVRETAEEAPAASTTPAPDGAAESGEKIKKEKADDKTGLKVKKDMIKSMVGYSFANETELIRFLYGTIDYSWSDLSEVLGVSIADVQIAAQDAKLVPEIVKAAIRQHFTVQALLFDSAPKTTKMPVPPADQAPSGNTDGAAAPESEEERVLRELAGEIPTSVTERKREEKRIKLLAEARSMIGAIPPTTVQELVKVLQNHGWAINKIAAMMGLDWAAVNSVVSGSKIYPYVDQAFKRDWIRTTDGGVAENTGDNK